jgi:aminoglycoside phosphotransferase (APT) family kinase protein
MAAVAETPGFGERVRAFLSSKIPAASDLRVERCERISGGFSWEVFRIEVSWRAGDERRAASYVLRMAPDGGVLEPYDAEREFRTLEAVAAAGIPVPSVHWLEKDPSVLGAEFYVMDYVPGEIPVPWDQALGSDAARAEPMHRQFVEVVAAIHRLDWRTAGLDFLGVPHEGTGAALQEIEHCERVYERASSQTYPIVGEVLRWLRANAPSTDHITLVHGDCRVGNFIWRDGRIAAFLDWERAFLGDPMADIAWTRSPGVSGWCAIDGAMGAYYEQQSGIRIDEKRVQYWSVLEGLKAFLIGLTALSALTEGRGHDLRLVTIGGMAHLSLPTLLEATG